jgi:hypothetical protein
MISTPFSVSWHTDFNGNEIHTIKKKYLESHSIALEFYNDLGYSYAKRLVSPLGSESYSQEWAQFIPGDTFTDEPCVFWLIDYWAPEEIFTFNAKFFPNQEEAIVFYDNLGDSSAKKMMNTSTNNSSGDEAQYIY